jgi:sec-independent protein translocase protein TatA
MNLGPTELIIILVIVVVLFGVGRIGRIAGELGTGIRAFREGLQGDKPEEKEAEDDTDSEEIPPTT